ncbi:NAD(P)-dependent alcohol dehydrogenase [Actinomadura rugatobispora]|uniref:NAD(P)-dependent alcohol dehydrogenase n=1 Tax=Actinomadura rugatobispora TaxID=1994 RepID=A0ABW1AA32_9ACTN|nr:NAD(P)-dependent alcohol dehydrogenase [Actinomadura rugatobispora]
MEITAGVTTAPGSGFALRTLELDGPGRGEVLVGVRAAGVCHTDLLCADGVHPAPLPGVFGHEGAGVVEEVGDGVEGYAPGDRVLMSFDSCGACARCGRGFPFYCEEFQTLNFGGGRRDGGTALSLDGRRVHSHFFGQSSLATHAVARARTLVRIPDDIPFEVAAPLGCGVQTGAGAILNVLRTRAGGTVAVAGAGGVGLGAVMAARLCGAGLVVAIDPIASRRALSLELGADVALDPHGTDVARRLAELGGVDSAVDTSGRPAVITACFEALRPKGGLALIGGPAEPTFEFEAYKFFDGRYVCGLSMGESVPREFVPVLVDHWRGGRFPVDRLVTAFPLADLGRAVEAMRSHEVIKPVLIP